MFLGKAQGKIFEVLMKVWDCGITVFWDMTPCSFVYE
jgi:hypothetical protein